MDAFYTDPAVRKRLAEFLGGETLDRATAIYVCSADGCTFQRSSLHPPSSLQDLMDQELDIARSLADRESVLFHMDIEYVNFDSPAEAYVDPWRTFDLQEPVVRVIESILLEWGIAPLHLITGQGHHFVWRVSLSSPPGLRLIDLNPAPEFLTGTSAAAKPGDLLSAVTGAQCAAFAGASLLMEYLAHRIKWEAAPLSAIPVEITAVHVGAGATGQREMISVDISEYGDPLRTRMIRMPYTNYLKPWITGLARDLGLESELPHIRAIPLHEMDVRQALKIRQDIDDVRDLARRACVRIPEQEAGTRQMLGEYLESSLRQFHEAFYSTCHDHPDRWPETYSRTPLDRFPPCVRDLLIWPNDRLLKPAGFQMVTRAFLADGWHPRHIAGLIRSKFTDPRHGWGTNWQEYDPAIRADFYTRLFAGQWATGVDRLVDFNCTSTQEKGFCPGSGDGSCTLQQHQQTLIHAGPP